MDRPWILGDPNYVVQASCVQPTISYNRNQDPSEKLAEVAQRPPDIADDMHGQGSEPPRQCDIPAGLPVTALCESRFLRL